MKTSEQTRAKSAALSIAAALGLEADTATVLHDSNKLTLRLLPCDALARVAPQEHRIAGFEIELAQRLAEAGCPVAALDPRAAPRVHEADGFDITLWTFYETAGEVPPVAYATALGRLHAGMRGIDVPTPHFTERVDEALRLVDDRERTPDLAESDRRLLGDTLRDLRRSIIERGAPEQLLHGEPHPGNLLATADGPRFIDFETCCRGPVEFDLAHAPEAVADHYPGADRELLRECRILMLAMVTMWRWDRDDQLPDGRRMAAEWLGRIEAALGAR
jgi:aminoglycoside phosphotransferase (APT) family kinase protein